VGYIVAKRCRKRADESPGDGDCGRAQDLFKRFHCFAAPQVIRKPCRRVIPPVLVHLGQLRGLIYSSDRGQRGSPRTFIHVMETPPALACDPAGRQLYILGGRYRVTSRGIEG
jgi:hypothetical protein